jgi:hypothetical protein
VVFWWCYGGDLVVIWWCRKVDLAPERIVGEFDLPMHYL